MPPRNRASRMRPWLRAPDPTPTPGLGRPCTGGVGSESPRTSFEVHNQKTAQSRILTTVRLENIHSLLSLFGGLCTSPCSRRAWDAPGLTVCAYSSRIIIRYKPQRVIARTKCRVRSSFGLRLDFPRKKTQPGVAYRTRSPIAIRGSAELAAIHWRLRTRVK